MKKWSSWKQQSPTKLNIIAWHIKWDTIYNEMNMDHSNIIVNYDTKQKYALYCIVFTTKWQTKKHNNAFLDNVIKVSICWYSKYNYQCATLKLTTMSKYQSVDTLNIITSVSPLNLQPCPCTQQMPRTPSTYHWTACTAETADHSYPERSLKIYFIIENKNSNIS